MSVELPAGSYKLTFSLKGVDDDGNAALPKECFLYILRGGSPDVGGPPPSGEGEPGYHLSLIHILQRPVRPLPQPL